MDELTVEEMLDDEPGRADLSATLAAIRRRASADGVELTVDLYGKIVALHIAQSTTAERTTGRSAASPRATDRAAATSPRTADRAAGAARTPDHTAARWRATDLAALIQRLATEATIAAHAEALAALAATGLDCALLDELAPAWDPHRR